MIDPLKYVRPNILALEPYSTARDECKVDNISVWIDANENPFNNGVNRYPDPHHKALRMVVAQVKGVPTDRLFLGGAGSDEAIDLTFRIFCRPGIDNVVAITPSYGVYSVSADVNDIELRAVELNEDFSLPVQRLLDAADENTKLMWICSPNNPTGNAFPKEAIIELCDRFDGIVVVDEAYIDFAPGHSVKDQIDTHPNLIVLQTFSKAWGMAGLRFGLAISDCRIAELYNRVKYPYNINEPTQKTLIKRIAGTDVASMVNTIIEQRQLLEKQLPSIPCVQKVYPSDANFLLVKVDDADKVYDFMVNHGVIVRNRTRMPLCHNCLRITVGTPEENLRTLEVMRAYGTDIPVPADVVPGERHSEVHRNTSETRIDVVVDLDGEIPSHIDTGLKFFDHMLNQIPHHSGISLQLTCKGDLEVDEHHTMEDVAIALGDALLAALGNKRGIERYGFVLPMDECRAMCLIDLGGRADFDWDVEFTREYVGDTPTEMFEHFFKSLCTALRCNLHIKAIGDNNHHKIEGVYKAFARALRMAVARNEFSYDLPSSKGML